MHAASALGAIGEPAIDPLLDLLSDPKVATKWFVVSALESTRRPRVVEPIARLLYDPNETMRDVAGGALVSLSQGPARAAPGVLDRAAPADSLNNAHAENDAALRRLVIEQMNAALLSDSRSARFTAARLAWEVRSAKSCDALGQCLKDNDSTIRAQAAQSLSLINDSKSFPPLVVALRDESATVRAIAAGGLKSRIQSYNSRNPHAELVDPLVATLGDSDARVRQRAAASLGFLEREKKLPPREKEAAVDALIQRLADDDMEVAMAAITALTSLRTLQAVEPIAELLHSEKLRMNAAVALAEFHDSRALTPLRSELDQKNLQAIAALGIAKDKVSVPKLILLLDDDNGGIRQVAAQALGAIRDPRAVEPLIDHLKVKGPNFQEIARALGEIKDPRAIGPLIDAARPADFQVQRLAVDEVRRDPFSEPTAWSLFQMGYPAIEPLAGALSDNSDRVREVAAVVLYNLLVQGGMDREDMQPAIEPLTIALADRSEFVRNYAAVMLAHLGNTCAAEVMLAVVAVADEKSIVFMNAPSCFGTMLEPKSVTPLIE